MSDKKIPVIDLFAGPGGLGEGFMSYKNGDNKSFFDIKLSIEKDSNAHKTLTLRSFYRQFDKDARPIPDEYYTCIKETNIKKREELIDKMLDLYPEGKVARKESRLIELGSAEWPSERVDSVIREQLDSNKDWVLIGGPPCQAYSNVGRSRVGGVNKNDHRVYLYQEYLRIIKEHKPSIFVMENVKGLLSAKVDEEKVFNWIKRDLQVDGLYTIHSFIKPVEKDSDYLIKSEKFGIPQMRHRVILLGVRKDFNHRDEYLKETDEISVASVIDDLPKIRSGINRSFKKQNRLSYKGDKIKRAYENISDSYELWHKLFSENLNQIRTWNKFEIESISNISHHRKLNTGSEFIIANDVLSKDHVLSEWYTDPKLNGVLNHKSRAHLTDDLKRYLFASIFSKYYNKFPRLIDYARYSMDLLPDHANVSSGKFVDRFRVQLPNRPATTITSHISKDGHYFIHYDPMQCRTFTVREAARIQTFPDNYLFRGSRTAQFHQVGNAVPPYLSYQIASIVYNILRPIKKDNSVKKTKPKQYSRY